nr:hypothetical protein [Tanacetum cinerariifolium]
MRGSKYAEQDRKATILYEYETFKAIEGEQLLDTYLRYLQVINDLKKCGFKKDNRELNYKFLNNLQQEWKQYATLMRQTKNLMDINIGALYNIPKQNHGDVNNALGYKKKAVVVHSDPLALVDLKTNVSKRKEKVVVSSDSKGSGSDDFSELKKITVLLAKAFNRREFYSKPTNNNLRTSSTSQSANKKQEFVKSDDKKKDKKADEKKKDMSKVKCYNCKKEGYFAKDCKKANVKDYNYYKTKMLLAKKDSDEQVLLAEDQAWMESSSDSYQEINTNMVFMAQIEKVLSESDESVKAIDRVSSYKSKLKVTDKSNSPKSRWVPMSERVLSLQPVTQYNPITGEVRKESEKAAVAKENSVVSKSKVAAVVSEKSTVVKESVIKSIEKSTVVKERNVTSKVGKSNVSAVVSEKSAVDEKDNPKVSKVSDESNKAEVVAPVIEKVPVVTKSDKETEPVVVADVKAPVVAAGKSVVEKDNPKVTSNVSDESVKAQVVKESVKASSVVADKPFSVVADKVDMVKDNINVVADKASDALKNKPTGNGKKPVVGKDKDKPKNIAPDVVKEKFKPNPKQKEDDRKKKLKGKSKKDVSDSELETDVVDYSSDEADRKRKKLKIKAGLKRKRSGSDSSELDTKSIKRLVSKLEKKVKKQESDKESVSKKGKKKLTKKVEKEESDEESVPKKGNKKLTKKVKKEESDEESVPKKQKQLIPEEAAYEEYLLSDKIEVTPSKIHDMLGVSFGGYSLFDLDEREADHEFVRKWPGQFYPLELKKFRVNDIARKLIAVQEADGLKGQICLDVVRRLREDFVISDVDWCGRLREDSVISDVDWCGYIYDCLRDSKLTGGTNRYLGPLTFLIELELKDHVVGLLDLHDEWNEADVQEYEGFIGFSETSKKEDLIKKVKEKLSLICAERVMLEHYMRKASLKCPSGGKFVALPEKYVNLFKDPLSFEDDGNGDNVGDDDDENGDDDGGNVDNDVNACDGNGDEEDVNEGDKDQNGRNLSFGFSKISLEDFGNDSGPAEKDKVVKGNPTKQGTVVEENQVEECEIMSTPENFTQWLEKNVDLVGEGDLFGDNSETLEAMNQEITPEKLPTQKASPSPKKRDVKPSSYLLSPYMNKKTNVVPKITRLEFILGNSLFAVQGDKMMIQSKSHEIHSESHVIYSESHVIHSESHVIHSESHFKGNKGGLALGGIDLYGHIRHTQVAKVKHTIPKLKWKTKENFHDCGIFTMLHMETFDGGPASNLDCGLLVESQL